jgi:alpha,alpha-trehalose-phosphate synthase [UDP-forming]
MPPKRRVVLPLIGGLIVLSAAFAFYEVSAEKRGLQQELDRRAAATAAGLVDAVEPALARGAIADMRRIVQRFNSDDRVLGIAIYDKLGTPLAVTARVAGMAHASDTFAAARDHRQGIGKLVRTGATPLHVFALPLYPDQQLLGVLALVQDASEIDAPGARVIRDMLWHGVVQAMLIVVSLMVIRASVAGQIQHAAAWIRSVHAGKRAPASLLSLGGVFRPLAREVTDLARSLDAARAAAEQEAQLRDASESRWTAERLRVSVRGKLQKSPLFVVANREPYMHVLSDNGVAVLVPASGLVTAIEPVLLACAGTWIAHGSGSADRTVTDDHDRLSVPPDQPRYTLRRVWLTDSEEKGYYQGFANEGLWPLCHIAHTRPIFRPDDWQQYQAVNHKFADAVLEEMADSEQPVVLVQDYHFALLPRLLKERRPDTRVAIFWHIPWPNPEAFGICPWQRELLDGLLGADLIGFHTQFHCNNFLETVERSLESRVEWERFSVRRNGHSTSVRPFPISVACGGKATEEDSSSLSERLRDEVVQELGVDATLLGVGVDRVDYTKGIIERFQGLERCLERFPAYRGRFTFAQIAAPSRTEISRYADLLREVDTEADRINRKFQTRSWQPIVLLKRHHSHEEIARFYRAADLCLITALHDGMNLVAKEFVASRDDEQGVLILSAFAGASHELSDAIIVNPYDIDQIADAIHRALEMSPEERRSRMQRMRQVIAERNVYRWAGSLIAELCDIRVEKAQTIAAQTVPARPAAAQTVAAG